MKDWRARSIHMIGAALIATIAAGCRRPVQLTAAPVPSEWSHCWWTVLRSTRPADSVAARFRTAFATAGFDHVKWTQAGDTTWVRAGPSLLDRRPADASYWTRAVAFPAGDTTHFRLYVAIVPPARGWAQPSDTAELARHVIEACGTIAAAADIHWIRRAGDPGPEEKLPIWSRVP